MPAPATPPDPTPTAPPTTGTLPSGGPPPGPAPASAAAPASADPNRRRPRRGWLIVGVVVTVLALVAAGAAVWVWATYPDDKVEEQSHSYRQPVNRLELDLAAGDITLAAGQADRVELRRRLQWTHTRPDITEQWTGNTLRVSVRCDGRTGCAVNYTLRVPAGVTVEARTGAGDLQVRDLTGGLRLETGAGDASVDNTTGALRLTSGAGDVTGTRLRATETDIDTGSGQVTAWYAVPPASVRVATGAGDVRVTVPDEPITDPVGYRVTAQSADSRPEVSVRRNPASPRTLTVTTRSGHVTVAYA